MTKKTTIIKEIGQEDILLPLLVNAALLANERIKYYLALLQSAKDHGDHPEHDYSTLNPERVQAGIDNADLDIVVGITKKTGPDRYIVPHLPEIFTALDVCFHEMLAPIRKTSVAEADSFEARFSRIGLSATMDRPEVATTDQITALTRGDPDAEDSLHIIVMDLHKSLNALQQQLATEEIEGAKTYLIRNEDRQIIRAFMAGLNRTSRLRFDHPGLGTTATRCGERLIVQNDIGVTDAHILIMTIQDTTVTVTYTDIHVQRLRFFQRLMDSFPVTWEDSLSRSSQNGMTSSVYHLSIGTYRAEDTTHLMHFLTHLGSRIVFLIDWNRARKRLREFIPNKTAVELLTWAAENEIGHTAFLRLGGERLIEDGLERASVMLVQYREPLTRILGAEKTAGYLQFAFRTAAEGLLEGSSPSLLQDLIRVELIRHLASVRDDILDICIEQVSYTMEIATVVLESFVILQCSGDTARIRYNAERARQWKHTAGTLVNRMRTVSARMRDASTAVDLAILLDECARYSSEAAFCQSLIPSDERDPGIHNELRNMADITLIGCGELMKALVSAQSFFRTSRREDLQDALAAIDMTATLDRLCDESFRRVGRTISPQSTDAGLSRLYHDTALPVRKCSETLAKASYQLHETILQRMIGREYRHVE